jgi:hypothetical protein
MFISHLIADRTGYSDPQFTCPYVIREAMAGLQEIYCSREKIPVVYMLLLVLEMSTEEERVCHNGSGWGSI